MELEKIHLAALAVTAVVIVLTDYQGYLYFRGKKATLDAVMVRRAHLTVWVGLLIMIGTGVLMVIPTWMYRLQDAVFFVKMGFVGVLVFNAFAIGRLSQLATTRPFAELLPSERRTLFISGALSWMGWVGATCIGFFYL